jgi:hypothetical protein
MMSSKMTRREALRLGTSTAIATSPLLSSSIARAAEPVYKMPNSADEICSMRAVDMVDAIRTKKVSSREVMQAHLKQIGRVNARVNAMVTMVPEDQLMAQRQVARPSAWFAGCRQRPSRNPWHPHYVWLSLAQRQCAGFRLPGGAEGERGWGDRAG